MNYFSEINFESLKQNLDQTHKELEEVFSKYPESKIMEGCPCCTGNYGPLENDEDLDTFIWSATNLLGTENDFKHYLPWLLQYIYIEKKFTDTFVFINHLHQDVSWTPEEWILIRLWFCAYSQFYYVGRLKETIEKSRLNVTEWLEGHAEELYLEEFPFYDLVEDTFTEMAIQKVFVSQILYPELVERFVNLLTIWPENEADVIAYAYYLNNYRVFSDCNYGIFSEQIPSWISKNEKMMEELFFKTKNPKVQKLLSESLPPNFFPTSSLNK